MDWLASLLPAGGDGALVVLLGATAVLAGLAGAGTT